MQQGLERMAKTCTYRRLRLEEIDIEEDEENLQEKDELAGLERHLSKLVPPPSKNGKPPL